MVKVIVINTAGDLFKAVRTLDRIRNKIPKMTREVMRKWGHVLVKDTKASAINADIKSFSGVLQGKGIRWEQGKRSDEGYLFIRLYGVYLDSMSPHFVSVTRRRTRLLAWARKSNKFERKARMVGNRKLTKFSIYVKPHPFIAGGYRRARPKLRPMINRATKQAIIAA